MTLELKKKVELTYNGLNVHAVIVTYTQYHENIPFSNIDERQQYEKQTGKCSQRAHTDSHIMILDVDELSSRTSEETRNTLWHNVNKVVCTLNEFLFTLTATNKSGKTTMQQVIPILVVDTVNIHYYNPNKKINKLRLPSGKTIHNFDDATIRELK